MDVFDRAWKVLEAKGQCDAIGSAEYTRLRGGWDRVLGVLVAIDFIQSGANKPPTTTTNESETATKNEQQLDDQWGLQLELDDLPDPPNVLPPVPDVPEPEPKK